MSKKKKDLEEMKEPTETTAVEEQAVETQPAEAQAPAAEEPKPVQDNPVMEAEGTAEPTAVASRTKKEKQPRVMKIPYEKRKQMYGYGFIALWFIGTIYFFIMPLISSLIYSFHDTKPVAGEMELTNFGIQNYKKAFMEDQNYTKQLVAVLKDTALRLPLIVIFSIFIAVILNQKFKGRTFARAVFFLPVIIATGPVINIINGNMDTGGYSGGSEQFNSLFETDLVDQLLNFIGIYDINATLTATITTLTTDIFNLVWNSGIQILLFLSALQNIPVTAKEAANIEGATGWEYFWKITIPYISPMILASTIYTIIDSFVDPSNELMTNILSKNASWDFGYMSAMAWAYFVIVGVALAIIVAIMNKFVYYEVE